MTTLTTPPLVRAPRPTSLLAAWPALLALCLTMLVEMVDNSVLSIALPTIGRDLASGTTGLQWIVGAYSLTFGGLLLVGGMLGDRFGRRRMLLTGLVGFGASSLLVLTVESTAGLIGVRALTGACAALVTPGTMSLLFRLFDDETLRRRAIGLIVSVAMVGFAIAPVLSAVAVTHWPWQALLVVNAPVALIAFVGVWRGIEADDAADLRSGRIDVVGALFSVATLAGGLYALTLGVERGWTDPVTWALAMTAVLSGVGFVARERRTPEPMLDLDLFAIPVVRGSALLQTSVTIAMVGVSFATVQLFQYAWGWSPMRAGFAQLPFVVGMFLASPIVDLVVERWGHRRGSIMASVLVVGSLVGLILGIGSGYPAVVVCMLALTVGMRLIMTTSAVALLDALPSTHTSIGSALNDTAQELGNALGVAVIGTVMAVVVGTALPQTAWGPGLVARFLDSQRIAFAILAVLVTVIAWVGTRHLTDSTSTEEHEPA